MKYLKKLFVLVFLLFISGCSIDYTLVVTDDYFDENINILFDNNAQNNDLLNRKFNPLHYSRVIEYDKTITDKAKKRILKLHYRYKPEEFVNANSFNQSFYNRGVQIKNGIIYLHFDDISGFAPNVDFDIKIKTRNDVVKHNADVVKGNTYIWHVDSKNKDKLHIKMEIKKGTAKTIFDENKIYIYIGFGIFIITLLITLLVIIKKVRNNSKV